eukprot:1157954-Pelagomonas_calceolata.AAC.4
MIRCALEGVVWLLCKHALVHRICMQKLSIKMCDCSAIAERERKSLVPNSADLKAAYKAHIQAE